MFRAPTPEDLAKKTITIKVAPPNPHRSKYPRLTHKIALAGARDFRMARVAFGLQVRPADSRYPAVRVNTQFWRLRYILRENGLVKEEREFSDSALQLSEQVSQWYLLDKIRHEVSVELSSKDGYPLSAALRDIRTNGRRYALECTMGTAIVRLFVSRRGVIGTQADFEKAQKADAYFDEHYGKVLVVPMKGRIEVPSLKFLEDKRYLVLDALRLDAGFGPETSKLLKVGDWIHFEHPWIPYDDPFSDQNALWLGEGLIYAHDYGMLSVDQYLTSIQKYTPDVSFERVEQETSVWVSFEGE